MKEQTFIRQYSDGVAVQLRVPAQIPKIIEWVRRRGGEAAHIHKGQSHGLRTVIETERYLTQNYSVEPWVIDSEAAEFISIETEDGQIRLDFDGWVMYEGGELEVYSQEELEDQFEVPGQSNLVDHARCELSLLGNGPMVDDHVIQMIRIFANEGHSGSSAAYVAHIIHELLQFKNLTPLMDDPEEWRHIPEEQWGKSEDIWQNRRNSEAFSKDGGKTYTLLSDPGTADEKPVHTSANYTPEEEK